jgi:hypothetical protein
MDRNAVDPRVETEPQGWQPPSFEVISLCCEITAYAPDDEPLF